MIELEFRGTERFLQIRRTSQLFPRPPAAKVFPDLAERPRKMTPPYPTG